MQWLIFKQMKKKMAKKTFQLKPNPDAQQGEGGGSPVLPLQYSPVQSTFLNRSFPNQQQFGLLGSLPDYSWGQSPTASSSSCSCVNSLLWEVLLRFFKAQLKEEAIVCKHSNTIFQLPVHPQQPGAQSYFTTGYPLQALGPSWQQQAQRSRWANGQVWNCSVREKNPHLVKHENTQPLFFTSVQ